jgi:dynein intermediate chain 1
MTTRFQRRLSMKTTSILNPTDNTLPPAYRQEAPKNMKEIITKSLTMKNPQEGKNRVYFSYQDMEWKVDEKDDHFLNILQIEGSIFHNTDKELNTQVEYHRKKDLAKKKATGLGKNLQENDLDSIKSMRNQFTFAERNSQTVNPKILSREVSTAKLERHNHSGITHKWEIFDTYVQKYINEEDARKKEEEKNIGKVKKETEREKKLEKNVEPLSRPSLLNTLKLVERQILQILNADSYRMYREWNHPEESSEKKSLAMLLPFPQNTTVKNRSITAICWNHKYEDLFAMSIGNYSFPKKKEEKLDGDERSDDLLEKGYILVFSVKNNYYPEMRYSTESGVLCLDFHQKECSYLVAGMYDGSVAVFDIKLKIKTPIITCDMRSQKHMDPVWQIKWYNQTDNNEFAFYSISSDGKVIKWSFFKNKTIMESEEIITLKYSESLNEITEKSNSTGISGMEPESREKLDEALVFGNAGGMCLEFNKHKGYEHLFVLGTEEGHIHLCSVQHRGHYINSYEGHSMGVYTVTWNPYHEKIFLSCSADWTIKIWHYKEFSPLIIFDMQYAVGDIAWSPWCSTIFAAVTVNSEIKFFDINRDRKFHIAEKKLEIPLNHIAFNKMEYVFLTGNDRGKVRLWRMADTLRSTVDKKEEEEKEKAKQQANNPKANLPTTKIIVPKNLEKATTKLKKKIEIKKDNKLDTINSPEFMKNEKERIIEFLHLLDVKDV